MTPLLQKQKDVRKNQKFLFTTFKSKNYYITSQITLEFCLLKFQHNLSKAMMAFSKIIVKTKKADISKW